MTPSEISPQIKEKSERSLPMGGARPSFDDGRRLSGYPGSRNGGSRPPSRSGSQVSLDSEDSPRGAGSVRR